MNYRCQFSRGAWNEEDWAVIRSPRFENQGSWVQEEDHLANAIPEGLDPSNPGQRMSELYAAMLYKKPLTKDCKVETICSFSDRMAPLIVFARKITPIIEEHIEVVLYDGGLNIWHHLYNDGKVTVKFLGFSDFQLSNRVRHRLSTEIRFGKSNKFLCVRFDNNSFWTRLPDDWPEEYYAGIVACEGHNHFYEFEISEPETSKTLQERLRW